MTSAIPAKHRALVLRTCDASLRSDGGFQWPASGQVTAPDCGGLHGFLWGEGDGALADWDPAARWLVVEIDVREAIDIGGKVKFPRGNVVCVADRMDATTYLLEHGARGRAVIGAAVTEIKYRGIATAGYRGIATAGRSGTATAGDHGIATAGSRGTATAGDHGTATAGSRGTATAGDHGTATAGSRGTATAGYGGIAIATAGYGAIATAGYGGTATAGHSGEIRIQWWCGGAEGRYNTAVGFVGEDGIEAGVPYTATIGGALVRKVTARI